MTLTLKLKYGAYEYLQPCVDQSLAPVVSISLKRSARLSPLVLVIRIKAVRHVSARHPDMLVARFELRMTLTRQETCQDVTRHEQ